MTTFTYSPPDDPLRVIHHDADLLVLEKPSGLLSVPGRGEDRADCLFGRARVRFPDVLLVHRLDLDTSGLVVFARTRAAQGELGRQFEARTVEKVYIARLWGRLDPARGASICP